MRRPLALVTSHMAHHRIIALTAPSGAGKTSIARCVLQAFPQMTFSVSATTRRRRPHERHGEDYFFVSEAEFRALVDEKGLIEFEEVYPGRFYGTLRAPIDRATRAQPVLLDIDVKGALHLRSSFPKDLYTIFVRPPSFATLRRRLKERATETQDALRERLLRAREELRFAGHFNAEVVNENLERAAEETIALIRAFLSVPE